MAKIAQKYQDQLDRIKKNVEDSYKYFQKNYERYHLTRNFVFKSNLTEQDKNKLDQVGKPPLEFNVIEAYVSRLRGEFSKQEPSINVNAAPNALTPPSPQLIDTLEGYFRAILQNAKKNLFEYGVYTDQLSGGMSVMKWWTDYVNEMSMQQKILVGRHEPTLVGYDPYAKEPHKGDGRFSFELNPITKEALLDEYPDIDLTGLKFYAEFKGFAWSYKNIDQQEIILVCDYYEKKKKKVMLYQLANNQTVTADRYKDIQSYYENNRIEQPPAIVNKRMTTVENVCRYRVIGNQVLEYKETSFKYLPHIFVDSNSFMLKDTADGAPVEQVCRPYVYNVIDAQKLKNFAGQTLAAEIENMIAHKLMIANEAIPAQTEYQEALINNQIPRVLVYNAFDSNGNPLPPPMPIERVPLPPEVFQTFMSLDQTIQASLGTYDAALGINNNEISGKAIIAGATQSNAAAMPVVVNFLASLTQLAVCILDALPKIVATPTTLPVVDKEGNMGYVRVNDPSDPNSVMIKYDSNDLNVVVEAGVNFEVQKEQALQTLISLVQAFPAIGAMLQSKGLPIIFDNLDIRGADDLKEMAKEWMQEQQANAAKAGNQPNPLQLKQQEIGIKQQQVQQQNQHKLMEIQMQQQGLENDKLKTLLAAKESQQQNMVQLEKSQTEKQAKAADLAITIADQAHRHAKETVELHHAISQSNQHQESKNES